MTPHRFVLAAALTGALLTPVRQSAAQETRDPTTLVIAFPVDPIAAVPTLWNNNVSNQEVSDLMFLRLADLGPELTTAGDKGFLPRLARSWQRRDSLTLVFELDPRARWHDGKPVTPADVILGFQRARDPQLSAQLSTLLKRVQSVTAEGDRRVVVKFSQRYSEQLYDAVYHALPLPAHLLSRIPPESLATSSFVSQPVGNGPYRYSRRVPGQLVELTANSSFFLGRPKIKRVIFLVAPDPEARVNLILSGGADAIDNINSFTNPVRLQGLPRFQYYPMPGTNLTYIGLNQRDPTNLNKPHPILADVAVRHALVLATDRQGIARGFFGAFTNAPGGPVSSIVGRSLDVPAAPPFDTAAAVKLLADQGWIDHNGDGIRDKDGKPLSLGLMIPAVSANRITIAQRMQESFRHLGIDLRVDVIERSVWSERFGKGEFDMSFAGASQDPTPSGLTQSWTCAGIGGTNSIRYCNPVFDSLLNRAILAQQDAPALYHQALTVVANDYPAIYVAAPVLVYAVNRRFGNVSLVPGSAWINVWQWSPVSQ
jgi:peptide/nickel transport system substrate-binding protein